MIFEDMSKRVYVFCGMILILNMIQAFFTPLADDEAYYWVWSQHLQIGYFDHPPAVAWLIHASDFLFDGEIGVRFFTVIFSALSAFLFWKIVEPRGRYQENLAMVLYLGSLMIQLFGFVTTPDAPLLFFTFLYLYALKCFMARSTIFYTLLLAVSLAGLMYSKFHGILVIGFTLIPLLKIIWKRRNFYLAVFLSLVLYSPYQYWLFDTGFIPFRYHLIDRNFVAFEVFPLVGFVIGALILSTLFLSYHLWKSFSKSKPEDDFLKSIASLSLLPFVFFVLMAFKNKPQVQWLLIAFVAQIIWFYFAYRDSNDKKIIQLGLANVGLIFLMRIALLFPSISPFFDYKSSAIRIGERLAAEKYVVFEKYQEASLFSFYNQKEAFTYRTIGNRRSQFDVWNVEEALRSKDFVFLSRWNEKNDSVLGWKNKQYYLKKVKNFSPYHAVKFQFVNQDLKLAPGENVFVEFAIDYPYSQVFGEEFDVFLVLTQGEQFNILKTIQITENQLVCSDAHHAKGKVELGAEWQTGDYVLYLGVQTHQMPLKYLSNGLNMKITE